MKLFTYKKIVVTEAEVDCYDSAKVSTTSACVADAIKQVTDNAWGGVVHVEAQRIIEGHGPLDVYAVYADSYDIEELQKRGYTFADPLTFIEFIKIVSPPTEARSNHSIEISTDYEGYNYSYWWHLKGANFDICKIEPGMNHHKILVVMVKA
jgi:hypothetical protein